MNDLFAHLAYPKTAGWKAEGTSRQAAETIDARTLRAAVKRVLTAKPMTADEVAGELGVSILSIRPRCTELKALGEIKATDQRRPNASGRSAVVWAIAA